MAASREQHDAKAWSSGSAQAAQAQATFDSGAGRAVAPASCGGAGERRWRRRQAAVAAPASGGGGAGKRRWRRRQAAVAAPATR
ncbi:hypothetical protein Syun_028352 [Stephania yunnanensis]|uniref:Uncharacterized protein n=1 Tax=Stephania yunnanensis TaxID=152371 RepID=A0AAP0EH70_9MAGN